jgi:hypothetical protein
MTDSVDYSRLPANVRGPIERYIERGIDPGSGLRMVLEGDIMAVCAVDHDTSAVLPELLRWLYNYAPAGSWHDAERVKAWMALKRQ